MPNFIFYGLYQNTNSQLGIFKNYNMDIRTRPLLKELYLHRRLLN